jgi:predicted HTH transcriptional regulator
MTTTLLDVRNRIQDDIDRTDLTSQVTDFVNRAIKFYEKENFWFTETSTTFVTVAGTETYTLSAIATNIKNILRVEIQDSSNSTYELELRDINYIRNQNTTTTNNGKPTDYCLYTGSMYLSRVPNAVYTIRVFYRKDYPALVNTTDTNDYLDYAEDLIEMRAEGRLYRRVILDEARAAGCDAEEAMHLQQLRELNNAKRATNSLKPTQF